MNSKRFLTVTAALIAVGGLTLGACSSASTAAVSSAPVAVAVAVSSAPVAVAPASSVAAVTSAPAPSVPASSASASSVPALTAPASSTVTAAGVDLKVASTKLGKVIVDAKGMTVYYFTPDKAGSGQSACSGKCLVAWPAVVPAAATPTSTGVSAKLGQITRTDGTKQATVDGRPVYTFAFDKAPGDVTGQGDKGVWYVISPDGAQIGG